MLRRAAPVGTEQSATQRVSDHDVIADFYGEHAILSVIFNELAKDAATRSQDFGQPRWQFAKTYRRRNQRIQVIIVQKPDRGGEALLGRPSPAARSRDLPDLTGNKTQSSAVKRGAEWYGDGAVAVPAQLHDSGLFSGACDCRCESPSSGAGVEH